MADPQLVEAILATIRRTESGNNYTARNPHSTASGGYQFINSTWKGAGGTTRTAAEASPEEQDRVARNYVTSILDANGGDPRAVFKVWYVGNPNAAENYIPNPEAGNTMTVGRYADLQMSRLAEVDPTVTTSGSGSVQVGSASSEARVEGTPEEVAGQLYGYLAAYLDHPEVGPIIRQAAAEGWSEQRLEGALHGTAWWNATNTSAKQWEALVNQTPTEAESQIGERIEDLRQRSNQRGFTLSDEALRAVAENSLKYGWNSAQMDKALGEEAVKRPGDLERLRSSTLAGRIDATIAAYGIPISSQQRDQWVADIAAGRRTEEDLVTEAKGIAKSLYPTLSEALDAGATVQQAFDPYRQLAADTLSLPVTSINLSDPKWSAPLSAVNDKGERVPMRLDQWQTMLRTDTSYGYQFTKQANDQSEVIAERIGQIFGKVA